MRSQVTGSIKHVVSYQFHRSGKIGEVVTKIKSLSEEGDVLLYLNQFEMIKKIVFALGFFAMIFAGVPESTALYGSSIVNTSLGGEISNAEKILVCCELGSRKIIDLDTAFAMLRDGSLTITKVDTGIYRVVFPGGMGDIILEIDD